MLQRLFLWFRGLFAPSAHKLLPAPRPLPRDFRALVEALVRDPQADGWIERLRSEGVFPQARFGAADPPHTAQEYLDRFASLEAQITESLGRENNPCEEGVEPEWFVLLADRLLPLAAWFVGVGVGPEVDAPDLLQQAERAVAKVMDNPRAEKLKDNLESLVERWIPHKTPSPSERPPPRGPHTNTSVSKSLAGAMSAHMIQMKLHFELLLRAHVPGSEVSFDFPSLGERIAEMVPPPAYGSPTSGVVAKVLCPAITVTLCAPSELRYTRGAHVRA